MTDTKDDDDKRVDVPSETSATQAKEASDSDGVRPPEGVEARTSAANDVPSKEDDGVRAPPTDQSNVAAPQEVDIPEHTHAREQDDGVDQPVDRNLIPDDATHAPHDTSMLMSREQESAPLDSGEGVRPLPDDRTSNDIARDPYYLEPLGPNDREAARWNTELQAIREHPGGSRQEVADAMGWNGPDDLAREAQDQSKGSSHAIDDRQEQLERQAVERVSPLLWQTSAEREQSLNADGDHRHLNYDADNCKIVANTLDRQAARLENIGEVDQDRRHFQGDVGEISTQLPFEGFGDMKNLNDPTKKHDNHFGSDVSFTSAGGEVSFEGDSKVSTQEHPNSMYRQSLQEDDRHIAEGKLDPDAASVFIPYDHVQGFKDYIQKQYPDKAESWLPRIHESGMPSSYYQFIANECSDQNGRIRVDSMRDLARDLHLAEDYLRRRAKA